MERGKIVRSLIYKFTERFAVKLIGFVLGILLARLLSPEIAGQVALLEVFVNLSFTLIDEGINSALVQTKNADERDYMTVFVITLGLALFAVAVLEAAAPAIAGYYRSPEITLPLRVYAYEREYAWCRQRACECGCGRSAHANGYARDRVREPRAHGLP